MFWLISRFVVLPVKAAAGGFKLGFRTGRVLGYRRLLLVGLGTAVGVLFAPGPGAELRDRLRQRLQGGAAPEATGWTSYSPLDRATGAPVPGHEATSVVEPWPSDLAGAEPAPTAPAPPEPATSPAGATTGSAGDDGPPSSDAPTAPAPPDPVAGGTAAAAAGAVGESGDVLPAVPDADPVAEEPQP